MSLRPLALLLAASLAACGQTGPLRLPDEAPAARPAAAPPAADKPKSDTP